MMKPKSRLPRHIAYRGNDKINTGFWWGNLTRKDYQEALGVNGSIILKWILNKLRREWINLGQDKGQLGERGLL